MLQVPAYETNDGKYLTEGNAIAYYVANDQLRGKTDLERAQVVQWLSFADSEILPYSSAWVYPLLGIMPYNKNTVDRAKEDTKRALAQLNKHLLNNTFLVGERISLADIVVFSNLLNAFQYVLDVSARAEFGNVTRWFKTILNQPQVSKVVTNYQIAEKAIEFDPKKYAEFQAKLGGGAAKPQKEQQPKKEKKPAPKKEKEVEPVEELDASELALAAEPKQKGLYHISEHDAFPIFFIGSILIHFTFCLDPFEALPKTTFNYDDFKRCYSNEEEAVSIKYFWDKFDAENNSIWFGEYKYNDELTKVFMSCNLVTGMFQRLDKMRKQAFASVCLFGEDNNNTISGIWVWRGQDLAFTLSPDWQIDYDCYAWKKLDPTTDETKKLVQNYLSWTGSDSGNRKFNQGKIFK